MNASLPLPASDPQTRKLEQWLQAFGFSFNPFLPLDGGADPRLSSYLVGHEAFATLQGDWPAILFAPAGGGKSAFRVRLAYDCRVGEKKQRVFPIVYHLPRGELSLEEHQEIIGWEGAHELLLELAARPERLMALAARERQAVRRALDWNAPGLVEQLVPQLEELGSLQPIIDTVDPSATNLPNPPSAARLRALGKALMGSPGGPPPPRQAGKRLEALLQVVLNLLKLEAIYLLVDGVDAYPETLNDPGSAVKWIWPLLQLAPPIYPKLFLPVELEPLLATLGVDRLTPHLKLDKISWVAPLLVELLQSRVQAASSGVFASLDAVSSPALHRVEEKLVKAGPLNPRQVLIRAGQMLVVHVERAGPNGRLEPADLEAATRSLIEDDEAEP